MTTPASDRIVRSLEENMAAYWMSYGTAPGVDSGDVDGIQWMATGIQHPLFNGVPRAICSSDQPDAAIGQVLAALRAANAPTMWWLGPSSNPADIRDRLQTLGLNPVGGVPGMAGELAGIETDGAMPDGFTVERAEDVESRRAWGQVCAAGTGFPGEIAERFSGFEAGMNGFDPERHFRFTGFASGVPVATSALVLDSDVAGIYAVATLPEARRKGYGVAVTLAALTEAKRRGYEVATLQASDMGFPLYEKLGFRKVCWFDMYL